MSTEFWTRSRPRRRGFKVVWEARQHNLSPYITPYLIRYRVTAERVQIVRIRHGARQE